MEILILHPGGLGDIILSLPAVALLRSVFPAARCTIAGNIDHLAPIVSGYADRFVSLSTLPLHHLYASSPMPQTEVRFWKSFDRIVSWTGSGNEEFVRKMQGLHPDACIASWKPQPGDSRHVAQLFVDSLGLSIAGGNSLTPARIHLDSTVRSAGRQWLMKRGWNGRAPLTALHPGAGSGAKRWPLARFVDLAQKLMFQAQGRLLIIEGPAERGLAGQMMHALSEAGVIRTECIPLALLAAVLGQCRAFVGNDSGIAHLSSALEVPSVVLFGPTLPQHWAPLGQHVVVLRNPHGCAGCASDGESHTCLSNITTEEVIRNLKFEIRHRGEQTNSLRL